MLIEEYTIKIVQLKKEIMKDPLALSKEDLQKVIKVIHSEKSQVGIDAQYTHAIIIQYLKNIEKRLDLIEKKLV